MIRERKFLIQMTTLEPFRVGGKAVPLGPDNPVATVGGRPVVPGPSLKGAVRSAFEKWLIDQYYNQQHKSWSNTDLAMQPCLAGTGLSTDEQRLLEENRYGKDSCHYPCDVKEHERDTRRHKCGDTPHGICPVCYLLGAAGLTGFMRVPFLFSDVSKDELYSARMDRAVGTVSQGANRPYELVPDQSIFEGNLYLLIEDTSLGWEFGKSRRLNQPTAGDTWLENGAWDAETILDEFIIPAVQGITYIGGYKSKGFGRVQTKITEIE